MGHLCFRAFVLILVMVATFRMGQANPQQPCRWLEKAGAQRNPRETGCSTRPWVCHDGRFPPFGRKACCNNRCVDVSSDNNNCGLCGVRCPFSWTCCNGVCVDPKSNPFHCGSCNNQCAFGSVCTHGMCGYAQPQLPPHFPYPSRCKHSPPQPPAQQH